MQDFNFSPRESVTICGADYQLDIMDISTIDAIMTRFPAIFAQYDHLKEVSSSLTAQPAESQDLKQLSGLVHDEYNKLIENCQGFIAACIGEDAYNHIFERRRTNCVDHIELCTYLYSRIVQQREGVTAKYIDPPDLKVVADADNESTEQPDG